MWIVLSSSFSTGALIQFMCFDKHLHGLLKGCTPSNSWNTYDFLGGMPTKNVIILVMTLARAAAQDLPINLRALITYIAYTSRSSIARVGLSWESSNMASAQRGATSIAGYPWNLAKWESQDGTWFGTNDLFRSSHLIFMDFYDPSYLYVSLYLFTHIYIYIIWTCGSHANNFALDPAIVLSYFFQNVKRSFEPSHHFDPINHDPNLWL